MRSRGIRVAAVKGVLNYNEKKVEKGKAERIYAGNFLEEAADLEKVKIKGRLENLMDLNQRVEKKVVNITLSFSPADTVNNDLLARIAMDYMSHIGFGRQPYVVYRHLDTFAPHLHIVGTNIRPDGSHIHRRHFGGWQLTQVRTAIEEKFGLRPENGDQDRVLGPATPGRKLIYGKKPTTQAIAEVVQYVRQNYRFRSISEFNAILRFSNVIARPGRPGTRTHQHGGLLYQALDDEGKGVGAPVKASKLEFKPTLKTLSENFSQYGQSDIAIRNSRLGLFFAIREGEKGSWQFHDSLRRSSLRIAPDVDVWGKVIGLLVVDFESRTVVKGEELGGEYNLEAIRKKLGFDVFKVVDDRKLEGPSVKKKRGQRL